MLSFLIGIHENSNNRRIQKRISKKNPSLGTMPTRKCKQVMTYVIWTQKDTLLLMNSGYGRLKPTKMAESK